MAKPSKKSQESAQTIQQVAEKVKETYLETTLKFDSKHKNELIEHIKEDEPELSAVGYARIPGTNNYAAYVLKFKGDKIISMVVDEPNLKSIAEESAKINFVNEFVRSEEF